MKSSSNSRADTTKFTLLMHTTFAGFGSIPAMQQVTDLLCHTNLRSWKLIQGIVIGIADYKIFINQ